jgi:preprotein translocase SecE subunit
MITFVKDSIRELKHVVWPTREETKAYFTMVLVTLILFGLYLFIANTVFSELILNVLPKIF